MSDKSNDWVFFATDNGMFAFDGNLCDVYTLNNNSEVRSVNFDCSSRRLFAGGISEFGYFEPGPNGSLAYTCISDSIPELRHIGNIWGIYSDSDFAYLQGDNAVIVYNLDNPEKSVQIDCGIKINCSALINGTFYLGTEKGIKQYKNNSIVELEGTVPLSESRVRAILDGKEGPIIVTANDGVYSYSYGKIHKLPFSDNIEGEIFSSDLNNNYISLGTIGNGVYIVDKTNGKTVHYDEDNGLLSNTVLSLAFDNNDNLWVGHDGNVEQIALNLPLSPLSNSKLPIGHGYTSAVSNGNLFMGTNRGLYSLKLPLTYPLEFEQLKNVEGQSWAISEAGGTMLLCHDHGLFEFDSAGKIDKIDNIIGIWNVVPLEDRSGRAIVSSYDGLYLLKRKEDGQKVLNKITGYYGSPFNLFLEKDSIVWLTDGTDGFTRLSLDLKNESVKSQKRYNEDEDGKPFTTSIYVCHIGEEPVFIDEKGIFTYDKAADRIISSEKLNRFCPNGHRIMRLKSRGNNLYILTNHELIKIDTLTGKKEMLPLMKELVLQRHYGDIIDIVNDSTLLLPTKKGYMFAEFGKKERNASNKPGLNPGEINAIYTTNSGDSLVYRSNYLRVDNEITLDYENNSIKIIYGDPYLAWNGIVEYRYRLNNGEWSEPTHITIKEYTGLDEGDYVFTLQTKYYDGTTDEDYIAFTILPPWYRTNIAYIIYVILFTCLIISIIYFVRYRISVKEKRMIKEQENEMLSQKLEFQRKEQEKNLFIEQLEREKLREEYNLKTQELTNLLMSEAGKNEILINIKEELKKISTTSALTSEQKKIIAEIQSKIDTGMHTDKVLERAEKEFNILHNNFTHRLRKQYPALSNSEIMLCSYIKMNLSTKEIAPLMNISVRGVETLRYRLRKKLELGHDESLSSFIANFD